MASDDDKSPSSKDAFNQAAPKTGHLSRTFNRDANVRQSAYTPDTRQFTPSGPGHTPDKVRKRFKERMQDYRHTQDQMKKARENQSKVLSLKDKFNDKSRGR